MIAVQDSQHGKSKPIIDPAWQSWIDASAYTPEVARKELGLSNGAFYRRMKSAPDLLTKLAMAALYEGLEPWHEEDIDAAEEVARQSMEDAHGVARW